MLPFLLLQAISGMEGVVDMLIMILTANGVLKIFFLSGIAPILHLLKAKIRKLRQKRETRLQYTAESNMVESEGWDSEKKDSLGYLMSPDELYAGETSESSLSEGKDRIPLNGLLD